MGHIRQRKQPGNRVFDSDAGIEFVRYCICGDYRRVINSQHLSKHDTDRETYMAEYHLTPDQLIAKAFRIIQSSRPGYYPNSKSEWIRTVRKLYQKNSKSLPDSSKTSTDIYMNKASGSLGIGIRLPSLPM